MDKPTLQSIILTRNIQTFNDELADFGRDCAFLSDAFSELVDRETHPPDSTTVGLTIFSQWVKSRTRELSQDMREIKTQSNSVLRQYTEQNKN
jgi:hypothetical protein